MSSDTRTFAYALEPLWRLRLCQLDVLRGQFGRARQSVMEQRIVIDGFKQQYEQQSKFAAEGLSRRLDVNTYTQMLGWLANLHDRIRIASRELEESIVQRDVLRARCIAHQQKVDALEKHREECVRGFVRIYHNRLSKEVDRDWLARSYKEVQASGKYLECVE